MNNGNMNNENIGSPAERFFANQFSLFIGRDGMSPATDDEMLDLKRAAYVLIQRIDAEMYDRILKAPKLEEAEDIEQYLEGVAEPSWTNEDIED